MRPTQPDTHSSPARALVLVVALLVVGAFVGLASAALAFPWNLFCVALLLCGCMFIPRLHRGRPSAAELLLEMPAPWLGYALAFHLYHGYWDGQGIAVGVLGFLVSYPAVMFSNRRHHSTA